MATVIETLEASGHVRVRCGVCLDKSIDRHGYRRADYVGIIDVDPDLDNFNFYEFAPAVKRHNYPADETRSTINDNYLAPLVNGIRAKCRHGHDLRVSYDRLKTLTVSADGNLYLPGN